LSNASGANVQGATNKGSDMQTRQAMTHDHSISDPALLP